MEAGADIRPSPAHIALLRAPSACAGGVLSLRRDRTASDVGHYPK